nr:RNA polymerase alpha subunit [Rhipidosiphon lewmanomontiae]
MNIMNNTENFSCISSRVENTGQLYGCFKIGPFSESQSLTFANALRRTLLAHQSKCIFNAIKIYGVEHEFSSLFGVRESVVDILLNLEKLIFQTIKPLTKPQIAFVNFFGPGILQGKHLHLPSNFKCINPSQYIATLEVDGQLMFKLFFPSTCEVVKPKPKKFSKKFSKKCFKKKKQWLNSIATNSCLNIFSQKFLKISKKFVFNEFQNDKFPSPPKESQENFLFLKNSLNVVEKINYTIQPFEIEHNDFLLFKQIQESMTVKKNFKPIKLKGNLKLKLVQKKKIKKNRQSTSKSKSTNEIPSISTISTLSEFIIFEVWTNGSLHPQTAILKGINELLLEFFPYSLNILKIQNASFSHLKKIKRKQITDLPRDSFRENFLSLDINNFYFDLETLIFLKNNKIYRIVDFVFFLLERNSKNIWNSSFYNINQLNKNSIKTTLLSFKKFIKRFL